MRSAVCVAPQMGGLLGRGALLQRPLPGHAQQSPPAMSSAREVRLILGDQLHIGHSWFAAPPDDGVVYLLAEVRSETDYALHHVRKVVAFFLAMRAFAEELRARGHRVEYIRIRSPLTTM